MTKFTLTVHQLEKLLKSADEDQEDMLEFETKNGRLIVTQRDWGHEKVAILMDKPC